MMDSTYIQTCLHGLLVLTIALGVVFTFTATARQVYTIIHSHYAYRYTLSSDNVPLFTGMPFFGCTDFFMRRNEFIANCLRVSSRHVLKMQLRKSNIFIVSGFDAGSIFFNNKNFDLAKGYLLYHPNDMDWRDVKGTPATEDGAQLGWFLSRFKLVFSPEQLAKRNSAVIRNIEDLAGIAVLGSSGCVDLFELAHSIVLSSFLYITLPKELSSDNSVAGTIKSLIAAVDNSGHEWFTWYAKMVRTYHGFKLYEALNRVIVNHSAQECTEDGDLIHTLLSKGDNSQSIISFLIGALLAGLPNTSRLVGWTFVFFQVHPHWLESVLADAARLLAHYNASPTSLDRIPCEAWNASNLPALEQMQHEILRYVGRGLLLRQNVGDAVNIGGHTIPPNAYLGYPMFDSHHNAKYYGEAVDDFIPGRVESVLSNQTLGFVGWGHGRHPCPGRQIAQTVYRQVVVHILTNFTIDIVNSKGKPLADVPHADRNSLHVPSPDQNDRPQLAYRARNEVE